MRYQIQFLCLLLQNFLLFSITQAKSTIEPCSSSDSCPALISYLLPYDSKISEIAYRFRVNISDILFTNSINPTIPSLSNQIVPANSLVKIPISCPCVDGIRRSMSTTYTVRAADTVDSISDGYGKLVSAEQISSVNDISAKNTLMVGENIVIPIPCTCFNNSNNGVRTVYMSYVVQSGESLRSIGAEFGTTVGELEAVNIGLGQPVLDPGDILAIPIPACSSANLNWYNESLLVPNGSGTLTANSCIKCICGPSDLNLRCVPSGIGVGCSHFQCKGSNLFIGDISVMQTSIGCNVTQCVYRGHNGRKIFRSLVNYTHNQCSGDYNYSSVSPTATPTSQIPTIPCITLPPSPSPSPSPISPSNQQNMGTDVSDPRIKRNPHLTGDGRFPSHASCYRLLLILDIVLYFLF